MSADHKARGGVSEAEVTLDEVRRIRAEANRYMRVDCSGVIFVEILDAAIRSGILSRTAQVRAGQDDMEDLTLQICFDKVVKDRDEARAEVFRLRTALDWHKRQLRVTQEALAVTRSTQALASARAAKAVEVAFTALTAIGEARGFVAYCSKGDGLEHWLVQASTTLATLLSDHPAPEPGVEVDAGHLRVCLAALTRYGIAATSEGRVIEREGNTEEAERRTLKAWDDVATAIRALQTPAIGGRDG